MKLSIIIVNFKSRDKLIKCINSIRNNYTGDDYEIIIVDNEKDENLKVYLDNKKQVKYVEAIKNLGFGGANNLGTTISNGEFLFFLNPDTTVQKNAIEKLCKFLIKHKDAGAVSPLLLNDKFKPFETQSRKELTPISSIMSFSILRKFFPQKSIYKDNFFKSWDKHTPIDVDTLPGAALMIRKDLFKEIGGFDEKFFLYFEENDLSKRIKKLKLNLYVVPDSKVVHWVGQSTKFLINRDKVFSQSRFYYLRKHFGIIKAIITESIIRFNKFNILLSFALVTGLLIRLENITNGMPFIGDMGWFYISARDMLIEGKIPLVGITSSHTWLHQGPLWTYVLGFALWIGRFNPLSGAYLTIILGQITIFLMYILGKRMFNKNIAILASLFYAVSPAIVFSDRTPFDPSPIPLFSLLYLYSIYKIVKGNKIYFPIAIILAAILYNLELATFSLFIVLLAVLVYGMIYKKNWFRKLLTKKNILLAILGGLIIMFPILIYDTSHGFKQTIVFLGWVLFKPFSVLFGNGGSTTGFSNIAFYFFESVSSLILPINILLAAIAFIVSVLLLLFKIYRKMETSFIILLLFIIFGLGGIVINQTASGAYLPIVFPIVIFLFAILLDYISQKFKLAYLLIILIFVLNLYASFTLDQITNLSQRVEAVNNIIKLTKANNFNLIGKGSESQFESFTKNYEYLLWWKQHAVSKSPQKTKIYIEEANGKILITNK